jgi:hypothetical protein
VSGRAPAPDLLHGASAIGPGPTPPGVADFDLGGSVAVRLIGASPADLAAAVRIFGAPTAAPSRAPEVTLRFTPRVEPGELTWIERGTTGFSDGRFFVFQLGRRRVRACLSLDASDGWKIACESGSLPSRLILPVVRLAALRRGAAALHASAFAFGGRGVLASGWPHGGKTTALLAFMERGARFVADDWVLLACDGSRVTGLPGTVTISDAHARSPLVRGQPRGAPELLRGAAGWAGRRLRRWPSGGPNGGASSGVLERIGGALARRAERHVEAETLFGDPLPSVAPDVLFLMARHARPGVHVEPVDADAAATRLACASGREELGLLPLLHAYRFAFPESRGARFAEEAPALRERLLRGALARTRAYLVRHPAEADPAALHSAMAPLIEGAS